MDDSSLNQILTKFYAQRGNHLVYNDIFPVLDIGVLDEIVGLVNKTRVVKNLATLKMKKILRKMLPIHSPRADNHFVAFCNLIDIAGYVSHILTEAEGVIDLTIDCYSSLNTLVDNPPEWRIGDVENGKREAYAAKQRLVKNIYGYYLKEKHKVFERIRRIIENALTAHFGKSNKIGIIITSEIMEIFEVLEYTHKVRGNHSSGKSFFIIFKKDPSSVFNI
ncbi:hypothetical protein RF11_04432 [Thelohanellus kitauei]|uniref:Uncharacterized protein n=1 Tax=Thelohanellus kitauei TaxID=669202 RepID=A0A0C2JH93_THEKT|nr:hypothetical protein RF11_04432 [Thelohanellus kitauei]